MKKIILLLGIALGLQGATYMAKVEPYESTVVSSEFGGKVVFTDKEKEFSYLKSPTTVLRLDSSEERIELKRTQESLAIQQEVLKIKVQNYQNKRSVKQMSSYEKRLEKLVMLESKQIVSDLKKTIALLKNQQAKKHFSVEKRYLGELFVNEGAFVNPGDSLFEMHDFSRSKLIVYLKPETLEKVEKKAVYLDGKKSNYKVVKVAKVRDRKRVSTYRVELEKENLEDSNLSFGAVVKVEFK
ncbi:MAG: HlyD family secretion protein [Epsilonproteobacteria bacterium]|nr:HlyD family secretion protein [Campylobacterota bacterium]